MSSPRLFFIAGILLSSVFATSACADTVIGKVVGPDGKPVPGATVFVTVFPRTVQFGKQETKKLTSDASGTFSVDVPPIPDSKGENPPVALVCVAASGFGLAQATLTLHPNDSSTVHLEKGIALQGKVVDMAGKPVSGVEIRLRSVYLGGPLGNGASYLWLTDEAIAGLAAKTDTNGIWTLAGIPAAAVQISVVLVDSKYVQVSCR